MQQTSTADLPCWKHYKQHPPPLDGKACGVYTSCFSISPVILLHKNRGVPWGTWGEPPLYGIWQVILIAEKRYPNTLVLSL
jgi:hypothetical protein